MRDLIAAQMAYGPYSPDDRIATALSIFHHLQVSHLAQTSDTGVPHALPCSVVGRTALCVFATVGGICEE